ncbi:DUF881 domain-containing protein [Schaalia sp. lx-260]|uniref:DUF881 domain-containing protein n=1 Tax=Schaalia sp. lx-260 TaxID=2899082 RepID=UPI001E5DF2F1|nr:DUF881 domain-containing protein [Schaalia sp. lx-260]MCD4549435.1 DUF881 domain-containing protein [Schaalia sp. lx-260]
MSLLTQLLNNPLDSGYESWPLVNPSRRMRWIYRFLVAVCAVGIGISSVAIVRALHAANSHNIRDELIQRAHDKQQTVIQLEGEVTDTHTSLRSLSESTWQTTSIDSSLRVTTASAPVAGPGLTVTLTDASQGLATDKSSQGRVRDQDLRMVVNALWAAGADSISINGNRVAPGTFIRTAGSTILVNVTAIQSPYEVSAIGDANTLSTALVRGYTGDYLSSAESLLGISVRAAAAPHITMSALDLRNIRYAEPVVTKEGQ